MHYYESDTALKEKHRNFFHLGKLLRELVEVYGTMFKFSSRYTFYHGVNQDMYFRNCYARICGPMSTTVQKEIATGRFAGEDGMILVLKNDKSLTFFFDCSNYSRYAEEMEMLFIGGFSEIPFETIIRMKTAKNYGLFVTIISTLNKMLLGHRNSEQLTDQHVIALTQLITYQLNRHKHHENSLDQYESGLFHHFCVNTKYATFNMKLMSQDKAYISKSRNKCRYGYQSISNVFFDNQLHMVNLIQLLTLFPNLKEISIEKWNLIKYSIKSKDLPAKLFEYVLTILKETPRSSFTKLTISLSTPIVKTQNVCPSLHSLKQFITNNDEYSCDICGMKSKSGIVMYGCFNELQNCNYSLCSACFATEDASSIDLLLAMIDFQSKFEPTAWNLEKSKCKNRLQRTTDAICFRRCN